MAKAASRFVQVVGVAALGAVMTFVGALTGVGSDLSFAPRFDFDDGDYPRYAAVLSTMLRDRVPTPDDAIDLSVLNRETGPGPVPSGASPATGRWWPSSVRLTKGSDAASYDGAS